MVDQVICSYIKKWGTEGTSLMLDRCKYILEDTSEAQNSPHLKLRFTSGMERKCRASEGL